MKFTHFCYSAPLLGFFTFFIFLTGCTAESESGQAEATQSTAETETVHVLFDGSGLEGWKSNEEVPGVFIVTEEGELKVEGGRTHLFWAGTATIPAEFKDFELTAKVKTTPGSNSGLFFHTAFQEKGWPRQGYEAQINSSHEDHRKTGSIYAVQDVENDSPSEDGRWFDYTIRVQGKQITIIVDGKIVNDYTEPDPPLLHDKRPGVKLSQGTIAIQGHDPKSITFFKDIQIKSL